jgi:S-disulfanyl-L-cysteine oxidoreductase SoxD
MRPRQNTKVAAGAVVLFGLAGAQTPASVWDGIYSAEQARRGEPLYRQECASCHGEKLEGRGQAPPLAGADFTMDWNGTTVGDLFEKMQTSMPADQPGRLSREQNATLLAFLLSANQFPAGTADLPSEAERLRQIRFEAAPGK